MKKTPFKKKSPFKNKGNKLKRTGIKKSVKAKVRKHTKTRRKQPSGYSREVARCDIAFSQYIRLKYANEFGEVKCFTCNFVGFWKQSGIENGHFIGRSVMLLRWLEDNCRPQCIRCNQFMKGNLEVFAAKLGEEIVSELKKASKQTKRFTIAEIQNIRNHFEELVLKLKQKIRL